jgi:prevent-host-death family protein
MAILSSTEAKQRFGSLLDIAQREPVRIQRHDRDIAVVISPQDYDEYRRLQLKQLLQQGLEQGSAQRPGNAQENPTPHLAEKAPRLKPRATIEEFREFLKFMSSQPPNVDHLREETFSREFFYGEHD